MVTFCPRCGGGPLIRLRLTEHGCYVCGHRAYSDGIYDPPAKEVNADTRATNQLRLAYGREYSVGYVPHEDVAL